MTHPLVSPLGNDDWLAERVRAQVWKQRFVRACGALDPPIDVRRARRFRRCAVGYVGEARVGANGSVEDLEKRRAVIAAFLDKDRHNVMDVRVRRDPRHAGKARVSIVRVDPFDDPRPLRWPLDLVRGPWAPMPFGEDEEGRIVYLKLAYSHLGIAGDTGAGKSVAMSMVVANHALSPRCRLWLLDGTTVDLVLWANVAHRFVGMDQGGDKARREAVRVLAELDAVIAQRQGGLAARKLRKVPPGAPVDLLAIDEIAAFAKSPEFVDRVVDIESRGRKVGVRVTWATQRASHDVIPTRLREPTPLRLALRCLHPNSSKMILGGSHTSGEFDASTIPQGDNYRGVGFLHADGAVPRRQKLFFLPTWLIGDLAEEAAERRGLVPGVPADDLEPEVVTIIVPKVPESKHHKAGVGSAAEKRAWEDLLVPMLKAENLPRCVFVEAHARSYYLPQRKPELRDVDNHAWKVSKPLGDVLQDESRLGVRVLPNDTPTYWRFLWEAARGDEERTEITLELRLEAARERVAA